VHERCHAALAPVLRSAPSSVTTMRAPEARSDGRARTHHLDVDFIVRQVEFFIAAIVTAAKASLTSHRCTSPGFHPVFASGLLIAPIGAVVNQSGACACT
jgi:hypothetical protein